MSPRPYGPGVTDPSLIQNNSHALWVSGRDIKTQYGVQIWWANPKKAGAKPEEWNDPWIAWFDVETQADSFALSYHKPIDLKDGVLIYDDPPQVKNDVSKVLRYTRRAIEVYDDPTEV